MRCGSRPNDGDNDVIIITSFRGNKVYFAWTKVVIPDMVKVFKLHGNYIEFRYFLIFYAVSTKSSLVIMVGTYQFSK